MTLNFAENARNNLLFDAAERGSLADIKLYLKAGANPNAVVFGGNNALMAAIKRNRPHCVALLAPVTDLTMTDESGETALMLAIKRNAATAVGILAPLSDPDAVGRDGKTALMAAARWNNLAAVKLLLERANPNLSDAQGNTALHLATAKNPALCLALLERCDPDLQNNLGDTALMTAIRRGAFEAALTLLDRSNARLVNQEGETALDIVKDSSQFTPENKTRLRAAIEARLAQQERDDLAASLPRAPARARAGL